MRIDHLKNNRLHRAIPVIALLLAPILPGAIRNAEEFVRLLLPPATSLHALHVWGTGQFHLTAPLAGYPHTSNSGVPGEPRSKVPAPDFTITPTPLPPTPDADLKPGFPTTVLNLPGSYRSGIATNTLVGNIDADPKLEILGTAQAFGPVYAWKWDGSLEPGWPVTMTNSVGFSSLGSLSNSYPGLEVFTVYPLRPGSLYAYSGSGAILPGWPKPVHSADVQPALLTDLDSDGIDEIFVSDGPAIYAYRADGSQLPGWPITTTSPSLLTPAIADLDHDGSQEIVVSSWSDRGGSYLYAFHLDGTAVAGFPVHFSNGNNIRTYPSIGDVDGDGSPEIVLVVAGQGFTVDLVIVSSSGETKRRIPQAGYTEDTAAALADLDCDGIPEIIVQTDTTLGAYRGDGSTYPGWPHTFPEGTVMGNSSPVVGDIDGDAVPDIVVVTHPSGSSLWGQVHAFTRDGHPQSHFPKAINVGFGAVPAIADIDQDGRNDVIASSDAWYGYIGQYEKVWAYDLHGPQSYGYIDWSQFGNGPGHPGTYIPNWRCVPPPPIPTSTPCPTCPTPTATPTACPMSFSDVRQADWFYEYVNCLYCRGAISGYADGTFKPYNNTTRGQMAKIVVLANNLPIYTPSVPTFRDVPTTQPFYQFVETAVHDGIVTGYNCGGPGEPCPGLYFRPGNLVTRGQLSKIVVEASGWPLGKPARPTFLDVAADSPFYSYVETAYCHRIISGYAFGLFKPGNNATRAQISKIVCSAVRNGEVECAVPTATATPTVSPTPTATPKLIPTSTPTTIGG